MEKAVWQDGFFRRQTRFFRKRVRGMYKYLNVTERMKRNPATGILAPKTERKLPDILFLYLSI